MTNDRPNRIPITRRSEAIRGMEGLLKRIKANHVYPEEFARTFNYESRKILNEAGFDSYFFGQYRLDPRSPLYLRVFSGDGTEACTGFRINGRTIIGRAIRIGLDQYVPNVAKDPDHLACDKGMEEKEGTEIVLISWSDPIKLGPYTESRVPLGALDFDSGITNAFEVESNNKNPFAQGDLKRLAKIWDNATKYILYGQPEFYITPELVKASPYLQEISKKNISQSNRTQSRMRNQKRWIDGRIVKETG